MVCWDTEQGLCLMSCSHAVDSFVIAEGGLCWTQLLFSLSMFVCMVLSPLAAVSTAPLVNEHRQHNCCAVNSLILYCAVYLLIKEAAAQICH